VTALPEPGTRRAVFDAIHEAERPLSVPELAGRFGLHHTAVRRHLDRLVRDRLVEARPEVPAGRGRPALRYAVHPSLVDEAANRTAYEELATILVDALATGTDARTAGRAHGRRAIGATSSGVVNVVEAARSWGFAPEVRAGNDRAEIAIELHQCPYQLLVEHGATVVCALHRGIAEGVADQTGDVDVLDLESHTDGATPCLLTLAPRASRRESR
jgi:predicted ArsR family transcriptional regulator